MQTNKLFNPRDKGRAEKLYLDSLSTRLRQIADEVAQLEHDGHHPIGAGIRNGRMCVELAPSPRLMHMACHAQAAYYMRGTDEFGSWRRGRFMGRKATVFWTERGTS